ncbi:hypothetical protein HDV62DRAFT_366917 [Trichoderma sp. SZMC 28011]
MHAVYASQIQMLLNCSSHHTPLPPCLLVCCSQLLLLTSYGVRYCKSLDLILIHVWIPAAFFHLSHITSAHSPFHKYYL